VVRVTEMRRDLGRTALVAAVAVVLAIAVPVGAVVLPAAPTDADGDATSGETLAGALAAHESDLRGDVDRRELAAALDRGDGDATTTAAVLAERRLTVDRRAAAIADRRDRLREARAAGELPANVYRVRMTQLGGRAAALRTTLADVENRSEPLPPALRTAYGLDAAALNRTRVRIAATDPGDPLDTGAVRALPRTDVDVALARNGTERALADVERRQAELDRAIDALADNGTDAAALACSRRRLADSKAAATGADEALAADADVEAEAALVDSTTALRGAIECLRGLAAYDAIAAEYDFELADREYEGFESDRPEWNDTATPDGDHDRWTATPTDGEWTWDKSTPTDTDEGRPTPSKDSSFDFTTPTPTDDS